MVESIGKYICSWAAADTLIADWSQWKNGNRTLKWPNMKTF
jgi:hypothetical protein